MGEEDEMKIERNGRKLFICGNCLQSADVPRLAFHTVYLIFLLDLQIMI